MKRTPLGAAIGVVAVLSVAVFLLQLFVLRPRQWPAGAGLVLSGGSLMAELAEPSAISVAVLPDPRAVLGQPVVVDRVWPDGAADRAGLVPGMHVSAVSDAAGRRVAFGAALPGQADGALRVWRAMYGLSPTGPLTLEIAGVDGQGRSVEVPRPAVWSLGLDTLGIWLREYHFGPLAKHLAYTLAGLLVVALGARGLTAQLLTLAFLLMGVTDAGLLFGTERLVTGGHVLLAFSWLVMPLALPAISLAVLHVPTRAAWLDQHRWVVPAILLFPLPLGLAGLMTVGYLSGVNAFEAPTAWLAQRPWVFGLLFGVGLAINIAIVADAVYRYRINPDAMARRRVETMVVTGVPGVIAYTLLMALPVAAGGLGLSLRWPWPVALFFQTIVIFSAVGLGWAVAVRRALSPRTVIRQGLQYALARKTLALVTILPGVLLVLSLIRQRDRPLASIISGQPLFYITAIALLVLGLRYRDRAQRWLDRKFFRTEYDAKEILLALASRVPSEADSRALVRLVVADIDDALHPEWLAVMADGGAGTFDVIHTRGPQPGPLHAGSGLAQLLQWSDQPLEVAVVDERAPVARLPVDDRAWLAASGVALLVPVLAGTGSQRPMVGLLALGPKRSEEPYSAEDRSLLAGIGVQLGLAADLWRLRRQAGATPIGATTPIGAGAGPTHPGGIDVGAVVDGKYRVDALIGRGGMGAVYRARDLRLNRDVAVKVVRSELVASRDARERFQREAQLAARLHHPAIVTVFDYGTLPDGAAYLVMELVRGQDLRTRMRQGPMDPPVAVALLAELADAVDAAHREQVLHRDLKPENVLLPEHGTALKVLDFGVARMMSTPDAEGTLTSAGTVVGTPAYMAPEQIRGGRVDARTDIFSLGVMGYEMLTGRLPFGAGSFVDVAVKQSHTALAPDTTGLPAPIATVLQRALSYTPTDRPDTAARLAADLRRALDQSTQGPT